LEVSAAAGLHSQDEKYIRIWNQLELKGSRRTEGPWPGRETVQAHLSKSFASQRNRKSFTVLSFVEVDQRDDMEEDLGG